MLRAYHRLHEAVKRLIILGHIIWWAYYTNQVINSYNLEGWRVLLNYLGPPVAILILINVFFFIYDRKK